MNGWSEVDRFLGTDPRDVGCAEAMEMLRPHDESPPLAGTSTPSWRLRCTCRAAIPRNRCPLARLRPVR
jgi:hypothetical protein